MGWWYQLQIKKLFQADKYKFGFMKKYTELDELLVGDRKKIIAKIYKLGFKNYTQDEFVKVQMIRWAENLNRTIIMEECEYFWKHTLKITGCIRIKENSIKMFYRWYITPELIVKSSKMEISDKCWKCGNEKGTFYHR